MNKEFLSESIKRLIENAFDIVHIAYKANNELKVKDGKTIADGNFTSLVFPMYREERASCRVSEQELRFAFVQAFQKVASFLDLFYSVETPTKSKYLFTGENTPRITDDEENVGESGKFDLVIHDHQLQRVCTIEFKANYPDEKAFKEVLLKLANPEEEGELRYLVHIVENDLSDACKDNLEKAANWLYKESGLHNPQDIQYVCQSLTEKKTLVNQAIRPKVVDGTIHKVSSKELSCMKSSAIKPPTH